MFNKRKVLILGAGYVGSASAVSLAKNGHEVFLYDKNNELTLNWSNEILPFNDTDLCEALAQLKQADRAPRVLSELTAAPGVDAVLICVATPAAAGTGYNLEQLRNAVSDVVLQLLKENRPETLIIVRSTLPPRCMQGVILPLVQQLWTSDSTAPAIVYFPEFLREGSALSDLSEAPLYILGSDDPFAKTELVESIFRVPEGKLSVVGTGEAEMIKISSNIFHALKVSFTNEIAQSCAILDINPHTVMQKFCDDTKLNISAAYLKPGFSFGGPCLAKELVGLTDMVPLELPLLSSITLSNDLHFAGLVKKLKALKPLYAKVGVLGLSFKAGSTDRRNSPVCELIEALMGDFSFLTVNESHKHVSAKKTFLELTAEVDLVILGSSSLTEKEIEMVNQRGLPVLDLGLNFKNLKLAEKLGRFQSLVAIH